MGLNAVLDTNIVLMWLAGRLAPKIQFRDIGISVITEIELLAFPYITASELVRIRKFLKDIEIIQLTSGVKREVIRIRKSQKLKLPDAIIAASAMSKKCPLYSNDKGMSRVPGLKVVQFAFH